MYQSGQFREIWSASLLLEYSYTSDTLNSLIEKYNAIIEKDGGQKVFWDFGVAKENQQVQNINMMLEQAIACKNYISFDYRNASGDYSHPTVQPLAIHYKWYAWYLFTYEEAKQDYRTFKVARMDNLVVREKHYLQQHVSDFMDYMALTDYVITNYDRHFNNFGVIRDTNTMKIIDIAPILDSGNSMFWNRPMPKTKYDLLNVEITSYVKKESKSLDMVKNFDVIDLSLLPDFDSIQSLYMEYGVPEQYAYKLAVIFTEKHQILEQVSSG